MSGGNERKNCQVVFNNSNEKFEKEFLVRLYEKRLEIIGNIAKRNLLDQSNFAMPTCL